MKGVPIKTTSMKVALGLLLALSLSGCATSNPEPVPLPAPQSILGLWSGKLVNTSLNASYAYLLNFRSDGTAGVTNEQNKTVSGGWTQAEGGLVTLGFTINGNTVRLQGSVNASSVFSGDWSVVGKSDVGTFQLSRKALD